MKALLKKLEYFDNETKQFIKPAPEWVEVDTRYLFNNQYNCIGIDKRVFDSDIIAIKDDARINKGKCRYCGAIVERGHEEEHYKEQEGKGCPGCWWFRDRIAGEPQTTVKTIKQSDGETLKERTTKTTYKKVCTYSEGSNNRTSCTLTEHRAAGVEWFTPENTYFLKYPNGYTQGEKDLQSIIFDFVPKWSTSTAILKYPKQFGSFTLDAYFSPVHTFQYFRLSNTREIVRFLVNLNESGKLDILIYDSFGYEVKRNFTHFHKVLACNDKVKAFLYNRLTTGSGKMYDSYYIERKEL